MCVRGIAWTEKFIISGGMDGGIYVWDRETWDFRFELRERVDSVYHLVKKGKLLAVALLLQSGSSVVELWDLTDLEKRALERGSK
jgi:WD40 repeat protein